MAKLPAPEDFGFSPPRPSRGITEISPVREEADLATGKVISDLGTMVRQEADKLDETVALDVLNQLQNKQLDLTYGDDGFTKLQGKGVIDRKIISTYPTQLQAEADRLLGAIGSLAARQKAQQRADGVLRGFKANVYQHAAKETETYRNDTDTSRLNTAAKAASLAAQNNDPLGRDIALAQAEEVVAQGAARRGKSGDELAEFKRNTLGGVHATIIDGMLDKGYAADAQAWLTQYSGDMSIAQANQFDKMVRGRTSFNTGVAIGDETAKMTESEALAHITKRAAGSPDVMTAAKGRRADMTRAKQLDDMDTQGRLQSAFAQAPTRLTAQGLRTGKDYLALDDKEKGAFDRLVEHEVQAQQDRAEHRADKAEARANKLWDENPEVLGAFDALITSPDLGRLTPAQIKGLAPGMGARNVALLETERRRRVAGGQGFQIRMDDFKADLPDHLQKITGGEEPAELSAFKGIVSRTLAEWKDENPGKIPTKDEQTMLVRSANRQVQQIGSWYGTNTVEAYKLAPMSSAFLAEIAEEEKRRGLKMPEAVRIDKWAKRKESRL
jgi:hypothetical protein